jgi:hypothetical protein
VERGTTEKSVTKLFKIQQITKNGTFFLNSTQIVNKFVPFTRKIPSERSLTYEATQNIETGYQPGRDVTG